jgi:hypothetical protein
MVTASPAPTWDVARRLTELTLDECASALGVSNLSPRLRRIAVSPFVPFARRLGTEISQFDAEAAVSLQASAQALLRRLHVPVYPELVAPIPTQGPLLVIANHPGVYDALLLFAALSRPDLRLIAAERSFLRSLPSVSRHLVYVPDPPPGQPESALANAPQRESSIASASSAHNARGRGLREVISQLKSGGAVLHFAAGQIEPDPAFSEPGQCLGAWTPAAAALASACLRLGGNVVVALVSGVHSPRVKHSALIRFAEAHGVTTLSGLIQIALPRVFPLSPLVRISAPLELKGSPKEVTGALRHNLLMLC